MNQVLQFMMIAEKLKDVFRTGWKLSGVDRPESVADHTFGVALLSMLMGDQLHLDTEKMIRMALIHDITESKLGDIHYESQTYLGKTALQRAEEQAVNDILPGDYLELWKEFAARSTPEAKIVAACDKLELYMQALRYEKAGHRGLEHFWENEWNRKDFSPDVQELFAALEDMRTR
ncbi:MAG: HD domain-containing protein [Theionarchaea archaeon]|nr:HD domain-containing protein [Theionarchaea archaeon]MBU7000622.1 HD domain-containing protein [Theionarchaea archaeon]MBU7021995.1 HD domain-containing protein [Theionarchaea archaeon]MBU7041676.1 HD domain-containing protein [Theionarchaea archaeon]